MALLSIRRAFSSTTTKAIKGFCRPLYLHGSTLSLSESKERIDLHVGDVVSKDPTSFHIGFKENLRMKDLLFSLIKEHHAKSSYLRSLAAAWPDGWMHIADGRAMSVFGRCPEPDDIIAMVLVRDGEMVEDSIQHMPTHRLLTVNGIFQLPAELDKILLSKSK
jgi:hypothetical protein